MVRRKFENRENNDIFSFALSIQPILLKIGLLLIIALTFLQISHYYHIFGNNLNPVYSLEGNVLDSDTTMSPYGVFYFTANIKDDDEIMIRINGMPVTKLETSKPTFVYVSLLDILEIDGTKSHRSYDIIISAEPMPFLPQGYTKRLRVQGKLYRLPPLY